jgi:hypothetical protein
MPIIASLPGFDLNFPEHAVPAAPHFTTGAQLFIPVDPRPESEQAGPSTITKKTDGKMRPSKSTTARYAYLNVNTFAC